MSVIIYGEKGNSGLKPLVHQKNKKLFNKGQTDKFIIECRELGNLQKLHVEHDNSSNNNVSKNKYLKKIFSSKINTKNFELNLCASPIDNRSLVFRKKRTFSSVLLFSYQLNRLS